MECGQWLKISTFVSQEVSVDEMGMNSVIPNLYIRIFPGGKTTLCARLMAEYRNQNKAELDQLTL